MAKQSRQTAPSRIRPDGRKSLLVYLPKEVIRELKVTALHEERHGYLVVEDAIRSYFRHKSRKGRA